MVLQLEKWINMRLILDPVSCLRSIVYFNTVILMVKFEIGPVLKSCWSFREGCVCLYHFIFIAHEKIPGRVTLFTSEWKIHAVWFAWFIALLPPVSLSVVDAGSILKVVSITQENWSTEEVVLEELQVFQVHTHIHRNTSTHTHIYSLWPFW